MAVSIDINRDYAYKILLSMEKEGSFSNLAIKKHLDNSNDSLSEGVVRRLVYGVTENRLYLDYFLDKILSKGISGTKDKVLTILRLGAYQLEMMDSVPDYAAIDTSVNLAKKYAKGTEGFVNGVLRAWQREKKSISLPNKETDLGGYLSIKYSCTPEIVDILIDQRGEKAAETILEKAFEIKDLTVRINRFKIGLDELKSRLTESGFGVEPSNLSNRSIRIIGEDSITNTPEYSEGFISIQSEESCWIADMCRPKPGDRVLDLCAAPGGKTLAMAEAMKNEGEILACDLYPHRLNLIEKNASRLGIDIVKTKALDGTMLSSFDGMEPFDVILVDAPCSGLGVMGKKPEIKLRKPDTDELTRTQYALLDNASGLVKSKGKLIYSTCTIDKRENHEILSRFLDNHKNFSLDYERELLPHQDNTDGFYLAIMNRL